MGLDLDKLIITVGLIGTVVGVFFGLILYGVTKDDCSCNCVQELCSENPKYDFCEVETVVYKKKGKNNVDK